MKNNTHLALIHGAYSKEAITQTFAYLGDDDDDCEGDACPR